ncbi:WXG100-like domain-containing protein, partial [Nocardia sp. NPDC003482]
MALYLPPELRWVSYIAGAEWPDGDEDKMFAMGDEWKNAAKQLEALLDEIKTVQNELRSAYASGTGGEQAVAEVGKLLSGKGSVDELAKYMSQIGQSTRNAGTTMEQTKLMVIVSLSLLAAEIALAWLFPPTAPGVEAAAVGATRAFLYRLGRQVMAFLESIPGVGKLIGQFVKFVKIVPDLPSKAGDLLANPIGLGVKRITPARTLLDMMPEAMARNPFVRDVFDVMPDEFAKWLVKSGVNVGLWSGGQDLLVQTIQIAKGHRDELNGQELGLSMGASMVGKWASHLPAVYVEKWGGDLFKSFGIDSTRGLAGMANGAATGMTTNVVSGLAGAGLYSLVTGTSYYDNIKTAQIGAAVTGAMVGGQRGFIGQLGARPGTGADFTATHPELNVGTGGGNRLGLGGTDGGGNGGRGGGPNPSDGSGSHGGGQNSPGDNGSRSGGQNPLGGNGSRSGERNSLGGNGSRGGADDITPVAHGGDNTGGNRAANPAPPARGFAEQQQALRDQHERNYSTARDLDRANQNFFGRQARNLNPFSERPAQYSINRNAEIARHGAEMDALNSQEKARIATGHAQDAAQRATVARNAARDADQTARAAEASHDPNATTLRAQANQARAQAINAARASTEATNAAHTATADATGAQNRLAGLGNDPAMRNSWDSVAAAQRPAATGGGGQGHELQGVGGNDGNSPGPQHNRPPQHDGGDGDGGGGHQGPLPKPQRDAADDLVDQRRAELSAAIDKHEAANNAVRQRLDTMQQRLDTLQQNRAPLQDRVDTARAARDDADQHVADIKHQLRGTTDPAQRTNLKADLRQAQHEAVRAQRDLEAAEGDLRHVDRDIAKQHDQLNSVASRVLSGAPKELLNVLPHAVKDGLLDTQKNAQAAVATAKANLDAAIADQQRAHGIPVTPAPTLTESHATVNQHGANVQAARATVAAPEPAAVAAARGNVTAYDNAQTVLN